MNAIFTMKYFNIKSEDLYFEDVTSIETIEDDDGNPFARIKTAQYTSFIDVSLSQYDMKIVDDNKTDDSNDLRVTFEKIGKMLNASKKYGTTEMQYDGNRILSPNKEDINWLMTFFEELIDETNADSKIITGYYDLKETSKIKMYYLELE